MPAVQIHADNALDLYVVTLDHGSCQTLHYYPTSSAAQEALPGLVADVLVIGADRLESLALAHLANGGAPVQPTWSDGHPYISRGNKVKKSNTAHFPGLTGQRGLK